MLPLPHGGSHFFKNFGVGFDLLPEKFTLLQLQKRYEAIWDTQFGKRNFINKIHAPDVLKKLDEKDMTTSRTGSSLYQFDAEKRNSKNVKTFALKI